MGATNPDLEFSRAFFADPLPRPMPTNGLLEALGAELIAYDRSKQELTMRFAPGELFRQGAGHIQGGAISAMLDFAMGIVAFSVIDEKSTISTTSITTSFYGAGTAKEFIAIGRVEKAGRRMIFTSAELRAGEKPIAAATSTLLVVPV